MTAKHMRSNPQDFLPFLCNSETEEPFNEGRLVSSVMHRHNIFFQPYAVYDFASKAE